MSENFENIINNDRCFSSDVLKKYVFGGLSSHEKHLVEKHLLECEICSDEVEGYENMSGSEEHEKLTNDLNKRIEQKVEDLKSQKRRAILWVYRIAAAVLILIVFSFILYVNNKNKDINNKFAVNTISPTNEEIDNNRVNNQPIEQEQKILEREEKKAEEKITYTAQSGESQIDNLTDADNIDRDKDDGLVALEEETYEDKIGESNFKSKPKKETLDTDYSDDIDTKSVLAVVSDENEKVEVTKNNETIDNEITVEKSVSEEVDIFPEKEYDNKQANIEQKNARAELNRREAGDMNKPAVSQTAIAGDYTTTLKDKAASDTNILTTGGFASGEISNYTKGIQLFQYKKYRNAIKYFNKVETETDTLYQTLYYKGLSYYELKEYQNAISCFDTIIIVKYKPLIDDALWYKAKSLIEIDQPYKAKIFLKQLVETESKYAEQAQELIIKLN